jgi:hypothetical protein
MTKHDWTALFIRILGLYLIATHIATFAVTTASLVIASTQKAEAARAASQYMWSGPFASAMVLMIGLVLIAKADGLAAVLLKKGK